MAAFNEAEDRLFLELQAAFFHAHPKHKVLQVVENHTAKEVRRHKDIIRKSDRYTFATGETFFKAQCECVLGDGLCDFHEQTYNSNVISPREVARFRDSDNDGLGED